MPSRAEVDETIQSFLKRVGKLKELSSDMPLFAEGLGLDSLETAELSAMLEDEFGTDPFGAGLMPETVGQIVEFYTSGNAAGETVLV